jgi:DMSO/TMAO reductase YedYZ molybdopterin-dependent catalytic subunit
MDDVKKKKNKAAVAIIAVIAALAILLAVFAALNRQDTGLRPDAARQDPGTFTVISGGEPLKSYTIDELKAFPPFTAQKDIVSGKHDDESGVFTGAPIEAVLDDAAPGWQGSYKEFIFRAEDAFTSSVFASDIDKGDNVIVVYEQDGAPIPGSADGGKGPLRILVVDDEFGNRSAQMVVSVEMKE